MFSSPIRLLCIALPILISGCASPINRYNAAKYYEAASRSEAIGDFPSAKEFYKRTLINARLGNAPSEAISAASYGYGRMLGYTCDFDEADNYLKQSLELEVSSPQPNRFNITQRLSELARVAAARNVPSEAANYFEKAIPLLEAQNIRQLDPIGYAKYLEEYASALDSAKNSTKASEIRSQASELRQSHPDVAAKFTPRNYVEVCRKIAASSQGKSNQ